MPNLKKLAEIVDTSSVDAARARSSAGDAGFRKAVRKDRRKALSKFDTVKQALADRATAQKARAATAKKKGR